MAAAATVNLCPGRSPRSCLDLGSIMKPPTLNRTPARRATEVVPLRQLSESGRGASWQALRAREPTAPETCEGASGAFSDPAYSWGKVARRGWRAQYGPGKTHNERRTEPTVAP